MGLVYVFNASAQAVRLMLNNSSVLGTAISPVPLPAPNIHPYTPFQIQIAVGTEPPESNSFQYARQNQVVVQTQVGNSLSSVLEFPAAPVAPSPDALWLYVFSQLLVLFLPSGEVSCQTSINWPPP